MSSGTKDHNLTHDILIVDDEADICLLIEGILNDEGFKTRSAVTTEKALEEISARCPSLIVLDIWLKGSGLEGLQLLDKIVQNYPNLPVIMISGHGNIETAVAAIKRGAYDFIEKPFKADRMILQVRHALDTARLKRENSELKTRTPFETEIVGKSSSMNQVRNLLDRVSPTGSRVMIIGPPGVGKETIARAIHARSKRSNGSFVVFNCAAMDAIQTEQDLFGVEKKDNQKSIQVGLIEQAHGGTLYLDEVSEMPMDVQGKIVRFLQDHNFTRVGGAAQVEVDVRVIASSNCDLQIAMQEGRVRQDLYYRLSVVPIVVPPLSERREDIPLLAEHFLERAAEVSGLAPRKLGEDALASMQAYEWPGNARQLRNAMEWVLIMAPGEVDEPVRAEMLPPEITSTTPTVLRWEKGGEIMTMPLREAREMFEREYLLAQVTRFGGNISRTSTFVGMERSALHRKLKLLGVHGGQAKDIDEEQPI